MDHCPYFWKQLPAAVSIHCMPMQCSCNGREKFTWVFFPCGHKTVCSQ